MTALLLLLAALLQAPTAPAGPLVVVVKAGLPPAPTLTFKATPPSVVPGDFTVLEWTSTNATSCQALEDWSGPKNTTGSEQVIIGVAGGPSGSTAAFWLSCSGFGGTTRALVRVPVIPAPPMPTVPPPTVTSCALPCVMNPTGALEFTASLDHAALDQNGRPMVVSYLLNVIAGDVVVLSKSLGKPTPDTVAGCGQPSPCVRAIVPELLRLPHGIVYRTAVLAQGQASWYTADGVSNEFLLP